MNLHCVAYMLLSAGLLWACSDAHTVPASDVIYACGSFTVYPDSIGTGNGEMAPSNPAREVRPWLTSDEPLIDALFNNAVTALLKTPHRAYTLESVNMAMAMLDPSGAQEALRRIDADGPRQWRPDWVTAAWEAYKCTGDTEWLDESLGMAQKHLSSLKDELWREDYELLQNGLTPCNDSLPPVPKWMTAIDRYQMLPLEANVQYAGALEVVTEMMGELGREKDEWKQWAQSARRAVNEHLWIPSEGFYSAYLYGGIYPMQAPVADSRAQALAVIYGVADGDRARSVAERTPIFPSGVPQLDSPASYGRWCQAMAIAGNMDAMTAALGHLAYHYALKPKSERGVDDNAAVAGTVLKVLFGIKATTDGLLFEPTVPPTMPGERKLSGLTFGRDTLDITISGTGTTIASFKIDGLEQTDHIVSPLLEGHHTVQVLLANNRPYVPVSKNPAVRPMLPAPDVDWITPRIGRITNADSATTYKVYLNDAFREEIRNDSYQLYDSRRFTQVSIVGTDTTGVSFSSRPHLFFPDGVLRVVDVEQEPDSAGGVSVRVDSIAGGAYIVDVKYADAKPPVLYRLAVNGRNGGVLAMPGKSGQTNMLQVELENDSNFLRLDRVDNSRGASIESLRLIRKKR